VWRQHRGRACSAGSKLVSVFAAGVPQVVAGECLPDKIRECSLVLSMEYTSFPAVQTIEWIEISRNVMLPVMSLTTFKIGKKEFVVIPRRRYNQLTRAEEDQRDAEIARKGRADFISGKMKTISHEELKKKLGL
jgi:hypothetical protein